MSRRTFSLYATALPLGASQGPQARGAQGPPSSIGVPLVLPEDRPTLAREARRLGGGPVGIIYWPERLACGAEVWPDSDDGSRRGLICARRGERQGQSRQDGGPIPARISSWRRR